MQVLNRKPGSRHQQTLASLLLATALFLPSLSLSASETVTSPVITAETISQLQAASQNGDSQASVQLGDAYREGKAIDRNLNAAFDLYAEAARAGNPTARMRVGEAYHRGEGTDSNQISAWVWLTLAARKNSPVRDKALLLRQTVSQSLSDNQMNRARILADSFQKMMVQ